MAIALFDEDYRKAMELLARASFASLQDQVNWAKSVPWYRRFAFGDQWPNKTHWTWLQAEFRGAYIVVERHKPRECSCSYCEGEHGHGLLWLPAERKHGWHVINLFHRIYIRWVPR